MVHGDTEVTNMQCDLDKLQKWSTENGMEFNALKSNVIVFGGKPDESAPKYYLNGKLLTSMQPVKYLGVYLSHDMKWCCHIDYIANKALRVLGLIKHLLYDAPGKVKLIAYVTLRRPLLEYACEIWDPTTQITKLENMQSKATRSVKNLRDRYVSVSSIRVLIGLDTLQNDRRNKRIALFHTVLEHESFFPNLLNILDQMKTNHDFNTRHANTFNSIVCCTNKFLHSFLIRTARDLRIGENAMDF